MAFGDSGRWHVNVNGVPFRVDGETYEEAQQRVADMLGSAPEIFDQRAQRLGLESADVDALALRFNKGEGALKGLTRPEAAINSPLNKLAVGTGRGFMNRYRGARQAIAQLYGDEEAAKAVAREDEDERELYRQLDEAGVGLEDVGEIGADITAFLGVTALGGTGVIPAFVTGAALGASDVHEEVQVQGGLPGETEIEGGRMMDAALGGGFAVLGPALMGAKKIAGNALSAIKPGASVRMAPGLWVRGRAALANRMGFGKVVEDAIAYTDEGVDVAKQVLGRAALDKIQQMLSRLPDTAARGLKDPAAMGVLRNAVKKATVTNANGVNVFNPAIFEKEATGLIGRLPQIFEKTDQQFLAAAMGKLSKAMQEVPGGLSPHAAERAAAALALARPSAEPIMDALAMATSPSVKHMLIDALVDHGSKAIEGLSVNIPGSVLAGTSSNVATEGADEIEDYLGARQRAR